MKYSLLDRLWQLTCVFALGVFVLVAACSSPAQDWPYIDQANKTALESFIADHSTNPKFAEIPDRGCMHSWSSGKAGFNCTNYGIIMWVLNEANRLDDEKARAWLADHVRHMIYFGYNWSVHIPGGEGTRSHPVWQQSRNDDSDRLRHAHLAPYCKLYLDAKIPLTIGERTRLHKMILDWADGWYLKVDWYRMRNYGKLFQYGRSLVPALGLVHVYEMTRDYRYLMAAQYAFAVTFWGLERPVHGGFTAYDTGYEAEGRTKRLTDYAAHFNQEPWQLGFLGETAAKLFVHTYDPYVRALAARVVLDVTDWVVRKDVPHGDLVRTGDGELRLSFLQAGSKTAVYYNQMTPAEALSLDVNEPFYPLGLLRAHYWDGLYYVRVLPNMLTRYHYPRTWGNIPPGPRVSQAIMYNWADLLLARYFLTGEVDDLLWTKWIYRDSKKFANRSSMGDARTLAKPDSVHYGAGNIGKTRGFAWWARGSLWTRKVLTLMRK